MPLIVGERRRVPPVSDVQPGTRSDLWAGLRNLYVFQDPAAPVNLVTGVALGPSSPPPTMGVSFDGVAADFTPNQGYKPDDTEVAWMIGMAQFSVVTVLETDTFTGSGVVWQFRDSGNDRILLQCRDDLSAMRLRADIGGTKLLDDSNESAYVGHLVVVTITYNGSTLAFYRDGRLITSTSASGTSDINNTPTRGIGNDGTLTPAFGYDGRMPLIAFWDRGLTEGEVATLSLDPYVLVRARAIPVAVVSSAQTITVGQATETESALTVTPVKPIAVAVGTAAEAEAASNVTAALAQTVNVGQATETEDALNVTPVKPIVVSVGQAVEAETALAVTIPAVTVVGQAAETESALPVTPTRTVRIGQAKETEDALGVTVAVAVTVGQAVETETALPINVRHTVTVGQATAREIAQAVTPNKPVLVPVGQATETEDGLTIVPVTAVPGHLAAITCTLTAPTAACSATAPSATRSQTVPTAVCD